MPWLLSIYLSGLFEATLRRMVTRAHWTSESSDLMRTTTRETTSRPCTHADRQMHSMIQAVSEWQQYCKFQ